MVASHLLPHTEANSISTNLQSAYKKFHFTESALLKAENDVLLNMKKGRVTALTLLDLSAAFDTIDHLTLINRLSSWYGISGTTPLSHIVAEHDVEHHLYADDTQIYISLFGSETLESLTGLKSCVTDAFTWITNSKQKLNPSKTEFIIISSKKQREKFMIDLFPILLLDRDTLPKVFVRNLGCIFDYLRLAKYASITFVIFGVLGNSLP